MPEAVPRDVSYDDDLTTSLTDPAKAAAYLDAVMELEDAPALLLALRQVAKAHGMAEVARRWCESELLHSTLHRDREGQLVAVAPDGFDDVGRAQSSGNLAA